MVVSRKRERRHKICVVESWLRELNKADEIDPDKESDITLVWEAIYNLENAVRSIGELLLELLKDE